MTILDTGEILTEYKDQVRILKQQINELEDAGKSKDAANKRCLQKLEFCTKDLGEAKGKIEELKEKLRFNTNNKEQNDTI